MEETPLCTKCGTEPRADPDSNNPWCKSCRSKYQSEYQKTLKARENGKGFANGAESMREYIAGKLEQMGGAMISAMDTANWIRNLPPPRP